MELCEREIILNKLSILKDAKFDKIGRAINIVWIIFLGKDEKKYTLHLQSFFRICTQDKILITGQDKFYPTINILESSLYNRETYNYDIQGCNLFDEWVINQGTLLLNNSYIYNIEVNIFGDLILYLSNDLIISIFFDKININECFRFFELKSKNKHFVVNGNGVEDLEDWINELK